VTVPDAKQDAKMPENFQAAVFQALWPQQRWKRVLMVLTGLTIAGMFAVWTALPESKKNNLWDRIDPPTAHSASLKHTHPVALKP
jgi:hypothetical protein